MRLVETGFRGVALRKSYGAITAADAVDVDISPGEVVGLLGPNGAGKSTIFRLLAGLETPTDGNVILDGHEVTSLPMHRRIALGVSYLPQGPSLFRELTVVENITLATGRAVDEVRPLLEDFGLEEQLDQRAGTLSGGFRRRLEFLRCVAQRPRYLLLDEPFAGVEPLQIDFLKRQIRDLRAQGVGMLVTDHAVRDVLPVCDRALIIEHGLVQCAGSPGVVAAEPTVRARYLGDDFRF